MAATGLFLTTTITKLDMLCNGNLLGSATGFFFKLSENWYIVTNWHVFSGRDPRTGQPRHHSGAVPDEFRFYFNEVIGDKLKTSWAGYSLWHEDKPTWLQHGEKGQAIDIAVIKVSKEHIGLAKDLYDPEGARPNMFIDLGAEVFIPGYPLGLAAPAQLALWKRASVASSLELGDDAATYFYVDTATREGMSGAPCIAISNWKHYEMDRSTGHVSVVEKPLSWKLLGVYSGRKNPSDQFEAQIGIVWREHFIVEIIESGTPGDFTLHS